MVIRGEMSDQAKWLPVEVEVDGVSLQISGPHSSLPVSFKGRAQIYPLQRLINWFRLQIAGRSPFPCTFTSVGLEPVGDDLLLKIDPGWPWGKPVMVRIARQDRGILAEWNRTAMGSLYGDDARCDLTDDGFAVSDVVSCTVRATVRWSDVRAVRAFKRDLFAHDMVCLAFQMSDKSWVEIWERSEGFVRVIERMHQVLPGIPESWYQDIWVPAFATMDTLLYRRDGKHGHWPECWHCGYDLTGNVSCICPECGKST